MGCGTSCPENPNHYMAHLQKVTLYYALFFFWLPSRRLYGDGDEGVCVVEAGGGGGRGAGGGGYIEEIQWHRTHKIE